LTVNYSGRLRLRECAYAPVVSTNVVEARVQQQVAVNKLMNLKTTAQLDKQKNYKELEEITCSGDKHFVQRYLITD
jgi:hypothetical protein